MKIAKVSPIFEGGNSVMMISWGPAPWSQVTSDYLNQKLNFIGEMLLCKQKVTY